LTADNDLKQNEFIEALKAGNTKLVANTLHQLKSLDGEALTALADMFDGSPELRHFYPYKLVLKRRTRGKPSNRLETKARSTTRAFMIAHARKAYPKLEAALAYVKDATGVGLSTLKADWAPFSKSSKSKKSGKKPN
jgi:hypothetical protein